MTKRLRMLFEVLIYFVERIFRVFYELEDNLGAVFYQIVLIILFSMQNLTLLCIGVINY